MGGMEVERNLPNDTRCSCKLCHVTIGIYLSAEQQAFAVRYKTQDQWIERGFEKYSLAASIRPHGLALS